jgi:Family of unknown function (DUF5947)
MSVESTVCDLCGLQIADEHPHLIAVSTGQVICACKACGLLFNNQNGKYKPIPEQTRVLSDFQLSEDQWNNFDIPVNVAFFVHHSARQRVSAFYPGAAGVTQSLLPLETWSVLVDQNPVLERMQSDVEALLINRTLASPEYYLVPIDQCYRLAGLIRLQWKGMFGGAGVAKLLRDFFRDLKTRV